MAPKKKKSPPRHPPIKYRTEKQSGHGLLKFTLRALLTVAIAAVLYWQWPNIIAWGKSTAGVISSTLGWGLVLIVVGVLVILVMIWYSLLSEDAIRRMKAVFRGLGRGAGVVALFAAAWGVLGLCGNLGGDFGRAIAGNPGASFVSYLLGVLRVLGIILLGLLLLWPGASGRAVRRFFKWLFKPLPQRRPAPLPLEARYAPRLEPRGPANVFHPGADSVVRRPPPPRERPGVKPAMEAPAIIPDLLNPTRPETAALPALPEKPLAKPETAAETGPRPPEELKQVAEDVWRKYGESPSLVTVDGWSLPPVDILENISEIGFSEADNLERARLIEEALASYNVDAKVVQINVGPTVTQFGVEPGWDRKMKELKEKDKDGNIVTRTEEISRTRVKVERITSLGNDLAMTLAAPSIRFEAPVPGKAIVGIEVPNTVLGQVSLRGVIETNAFQKIAARSKLAVALGKGAGGEAVSGDLVRMPHLLIAGATGSGKTVCMNTIISCLLLRNTPLDLKFIMIDPKRVELTPFNGIPHLATPVIVDTGKAVSALRWLGQEMDKRYQTVAAAGSRNIEGYNKNRTGEDRLPYLVLVIDELADLMMTASSDEVEQTLCRLAQLGRAAGIHLIVATQRPSVDVVTGLIKANFPTRISFAVTSQVDSRTILDGAGAEKLLGRGDMLYAPTEAGKPKRLQGCYVSDIETERLVFFWGNQRREERLSLNLDELAAPPAAGAGAFPDDALLEAARELQQEHRQISASFLQRRLRIGYPRAARIMEQLLKEMAEEEGEGE